MKHTEAPGEQLGRHLEFLDEILAKSGVPVGQRPFHAATDLIRYKLVKVSTDSGKTRYEPDGSSDFLEAYWFKAIYKMVDDWYRERFGVRFDCPPEATVKGVVLIRSTPFVMKIPVNRTRPDQPGKTVWISFPEEIESDENSTSWLVRGPNLSQMDQAQSASVIAATDDVADSLRFIRTNLMGVEGADPEGLSFRRGVITHLERAAELIEHQDVEAASKAWWELQMALESSLKALLLQKNGRYPYTHDLVELLTLGQTVGLVFDAGKLAGWPKPSEVSGLRYGHGGRQYTQTVFDGYRVALSLARAAVEAMARMRLGKARFQIQQPPWIVGGMQVEFGDTPIAVASDQPGE
ncbi:HEPN domain-containing protein [Mesorhizobium sp. M1066]|uniref:HEPN domain-containing protein n=1 Tax=unclassified Mesorhizobium TaxID=325217 RepID=UPI003334CBFC